MMRLQIEAAALRNVTSGGVATKVIAVGIGDGINVTELRGIASTPHSRTLFRVPDFSRLPTIEERLRNEFCSGKQVPFAVVLNCIYHTISAVISKLCFYISGNS